MLPILYQDEFIVLVNKPSGLLSVPGKNSEQESATSFIKRLFPHCVQHPAVHRLDMDTSGILIFALDSFCHRDLSVQFQNRQIKKRYTAVLAGVLDEKKGNSGVIELPFRLDVDNRPVQIYDPIHGKTGVTHWQKIETKNQQTKVHFYPKTGRTHQLRVHSAHQKGLGIPIVGDTLYGGHPRHGELLLHATEITFSHPRTKKSMTIISNPPF